MDLEKELQTSWLFGERPQLRPGHGAFPQSSVLSHRHTRGLCGGRRGKAVLRRCLLPFQVPASGEDDAACLPEQEWGGVDSRQQELYRMAVKGSYEAVVSLGEVHSLRLCQTLSSPRLNLALHRLLCYLDVCRQAVNGEALAPLAPLGFGHG